MPPVSSSGVLVADDTAEDDAGGAPPSHRAPGKQRCWLLWLLLVALIALPLIVALIALHGTHWYPVLDLAMTEVRVRDVGGAHTPLIGLPGRIGGPSIAQQGSHPGPLSFYALAPGYRLFGSSAWSMEAATGLLSITAIGLSLWIARRRGGNTLMLAVAVVLAFMVRGYGVGTLTEAWNPYLPLMWWMLFLLAVWSVLCRDVKMLPVAVFAGSFCAQTHVPYLGSTVVLGAVAFGTTLVMARRSPRPSAFRRDAFRWGIASLLLAAVLWSPLVIDQIQNEPGNLSTLSEYFRDPNAFRLKNSPDPPDEPVGLREGVKLELLHLDLTRITNDQQGDTGSLVNASTGPAGSTIPGVLMLAVWGASVVVAYKLRHRRLLMLDTVIGLALVLAVISMSRIFGHIWYYLMLWSWAITALMVLTIVWTAATWWVRRHPGDKTRVAHAGALVMLGLIVVSTLTLGVSARTTDVAAPGLSRQLEHLMPQTMAALDAHKGTATGKDGRYSVTMSDALYIGSQGYGIVLDLERHGYTAGMPAVFHVPMTDYRVIDTVDATAVVHFATGFHIDEWRAKPDVVEVAYVDDRTDAEKAEFAALREKSIKGLHDIGLDDKIGEVDGNLFGVAIDDRLTPTLQRDLQRMLDIGIPAAMFLAPPGTLL